jgi:hypothetical protein
MRMACSLDGTTGTVLDLFSRRYPSTFRAAAALLYTNGHGPRCCCLSRHSVFFFNPGETKCQHVQIMAARRDDESLRTLAEPSH